jgi:hypothetical protein
MWHEEGYSWGVKKWKVPRIGDSLLDHEVAPIGPALIHAIP